jgi:hypothetical protein
MTENTINTVEKWATNKLIEDAAKTTAALHELADAIEREARSFAKVGTPGTDTYAGVVARIIRRIGQDVLNLPTDLMIHAASDADRDRAKRETNA